MTETKKPAAKQVSIAAFFSPKATRKASPATTTSHKEEQEQQTTVDVDVETTTSPPLPLSSEKPATISVEAFTTPPSVAGKRKRTARSSNDAQAKEAAPAVVDLTDATPPVATGNTKTAVKTGKAAAATRTAKRTRRAPAKAKAAKPAVAVAAKSPYFGVSPHDQTGHMTTSDDEDEDDGDVQQGYAVATDQAAEDDNTAVDVVDLADVVDVSQEQTADIIPVIASSPSTPVATKARKTTTKAAAATTTATSTAPARQKKSLKKDAVAVSTAASSPPQHQSPQKLPVAEPADPVVRARIASYKHKIDDLTRLCATLLQSSRADDAVLQEIYGLRGGHAEPNDSERREIQEAWRQLNTDAAAQSSATATTELPTALKHFVARAIQSRSDGLTELIASIATALDTDSTTDGTHQANAASCTLALEMEVKMLAQRTSYGARPAKANLYEDTTPEALWCWEVNNVELHFSDDVQKDIKRLRKQRKRTGAQLKSLARVLQLLHQTPTIDEVKVANEEAKIGKFVSQVESELLKARDREKKEEEKHKKEVEKAHAVEEKKRIDHEKQQAKEEEKKKKEDEQEAERLLAEKQRKSLVSYFSTAATVASGSSSNSGGKAAASSNSNNSGSSKDDVAGEVAAAPVSKRKTEKMARMDHAIDFLVRDAGASTPRSQYNAPPSLLQRRRALVTARIGSWSRRQFRDEKLGIMKLLQFHENHRPAYYGTFHKRSRLFRRGRRPLAEYAQFDYSVDSEEEWEEEEPGESLSGADSDMDDDDGDDQLDYGDDWLAYEDEVEYVDGEDQRDDEDVVMMLDDETDGADGNGVAQATASSKKRRRRRVAAENKKQKLTKLEPQVSGPFVCCEDECEHGPLSRYAGELLETAPEFVSPLMKRAQAIAEQIAAAKQRESQSPTLAAGGSTDGSKAATPVAKKPKKIKTTSAGTTTAPNAATLLAAVHKPPVKRKIAPQLVMAASVNGESATVKSAAKKAKGADKPLPEPSQSQSVAAAAVAVPRSSPAKSGITGWLKTPAPTAFAMDAPPTSTSSIVDVAVTSPPPPPSASLAPGEI